MLSLIIVSLYIVLKEVTTNVQLRGTQFVILQQDFCCKLIDFNNGELSSFLPSGR